MIDVLQLETAERVARKAAHMAQTDPHGLTLTLVSVCVVFGVLLILFVVYAVSGEIFMRKRKIRQTVKSIGRAYGNFTKNAPQEERDVAIAVALHMYLEQNSIHDNESGVITIKR